MDHLEKQLQSADNKLIEIESEKETIQLHTEKLQQQNKVTWIGFQGMQFIAIAPIMKKCCFFPSSHSSLKQKCFAIFKI